MTTAPLVATASIRVAVDPLTAFRIFTDDINAWWQRGTRYWNDHERGLAYRFEPGVGGRLVEVYADGEFEVGAIDAWVPGELLVFGWHQESWPPNSTTRVTVRFTPADDGVGTLVAIEHDGWEAVGEPGIGMSIGYEQGWVELLDMYLGAVPPAAES